MRRITPRTTIDKKTFEKVVGEFVADERRRGVSLHTISITLGVLSRLLAHATGERTARNDAAAVDPADVERLLAACKDDRQRAAILLAAEAGLGAGEICDLQWSDLGDAHLRVRVSKSDEPLSVPLSPRLAETFAVLPRLGRWIVSKLDGSRIEHGALARAISSICDRANVARTRLLHRLRLASRASGVAKEGD